MIACYHALGIGHLHTRLLAGDTPDKRFHLIPPARGNAVMAFYEAVKLLLRAEDLRNSVRHDLTVGIRFRERASLLFVQLRISAPEYLLAQLVPVLTLRRVHLTHDRHEVIVMLVSLRRMRQLV